MIVSKVRREAYRGSPRQTMAASLASHFTELHELKCLSGLGGGHDHTKLYASKAFDNYPTRLQKV